MITRVSYTYKALSEMTFAQWLWFYLGSVLTVDRVYPLGQYYNVESLTFIEEKSHSHKQN